MLESVVERRLKDALEAVDDRIMYLKFVSPGCTGVPDRVILVPGGEVAFVELKAPAKTERARQQYVQGLIRDLGFVVFSTVRTAKQIDEVVSWCREAVERG